MKPTHLLFIPFLLLIFAFASDAELLKIRTMYYKAVSEKENSLLFFNEMQKYAGSKEAIMLGYIGMSYMLEANRVWSPYTKLSNFNTGKIYLDKAIDNDPKNAELRFLRFGVQTNAPSFLGYNSKITEDKIALIKTYSTLSDTDLKTRIKEFILTCDYCSAEEKNKFK